MNAIHVAKLNFETALVKFHFTQAARFLLDRCLRFRDFSLKVYKNLGTKLGLDLNNDLQCAGTDELERTPPSSRQAVKSLVPLSVISTVRFRSIQDLNRRFGARGLDLGQ